MKNNIILLLLCFLFSLPALAFKFSPMSSTIDYKMNQNTSLFYLENDSDLPVAIQVSISTREMDSKGLEKNTIVKDDFSLYPSQIIIPANEKRSVKVTYLGLVKPKKEIAYRLIAEQLPIDLETSKKNKKSIKILLRYVAALYISSEDLQSEVVAKALTLDDNNVFLTLENKGNKHQVISHLNINFLDEKSKKETNFTTEELKGVSGENILATSERIFTFPKKGKFLNIQPTDKVKIYFDKD
jgi:fimbrial chaperone protein